MPLFQTHTRHLLPTVAISLALAGCQGCQGSPAPSPEPHAQQPAKAHADAPANHLIHESSPYLLQHAHNPVDWYPWSPEALEKAKREDKPIFLSIGYSACHWCHVMAHESFEDPGIAKLMNASFVNIKVDREERPDLDEIYMQAVVSMTGSGGWPMSVWLTPDLKPFYGGTYFAPDSKYGRPGFRTLLEELSKAWRERRPELLKSGETLAQAIREEARLEGGAGELRRDAIPAAAESLKRHFDQEYGGFGGAPKFPPSMDLRLLLREWRRTGDPQLLQMVETTLDRMARGGMYDQLGGGFHRYSTDGQWRVPHFEKMLYDNALLARIYVEAWQATGKPQYARIAREVCDYVLREMTSPEGGFYSSQDADSEEGEGAFFVWTPAEVEVVLGKEDGALFCQTYDVTKTGNFEGGRSVLWLPKPPSSGLGDRLDAMKAKLLAARERRVKPGRDEKILTDWNGLMIQALAEAGWALDEPRYLEAARKGADFCLTRMMKEGRVLHTYGRGEAKLPAYLDDHAFLASGCVALFESTGDSRWLREATRLSQLMTEHFWDSSNGGFFFTANDHEAPIARTKHPGDQAIPSGNSVAAGVFLRLAALSGDKSWREKAEKTILAFQGSYARQPRGFAEMLCTLDFATAPGQEIVIASQPGDPATRALLAEVRRRFLPDAVILPFDPMSADGRVLVKTVPLLEGRGLAQGKPAAYVCSRGVCQLSVTEPASLGKSLDSPVKTAE